MKRLDCEALGGCCLKLVSVIARLEIPKDPISSVDTKNMDPEIKWTNLSLTTFKTRWDY